MNPQHPSFPSANRRALLGIGAGFALLSGRLRAQDFPARPITLIVPFAAGGTGDLVARHLAPLLSARLGQQVVVENRTGGGGIIGWSAVANARKDGHALLATDTSYGMAIAMGVRAPVDLRNAFTHVSTTATSPFVVAVGPTVAAKNLQEFITFARAHPGKLNYGSGGVGTSSHLGAEWFKSLTGTSMVQVAYRGGSSVVADLIGGQVDVAFLAVGSVLPHVRSGKLRALAVSAERRTLALPDVPNAREAGVPDFIGVNWFVIAAPAGTPSTIVERLNREITGALQLPEVRAKFEASGLEAAPATPQATHAFVEADIKRWSEVVRTARIQPE